MSGKNNFEDLKLAAVEKEEREQIYSRIRMLVSALFEIRNCYEYICNGIIDSKPFASGKMYGGFKRKLYLAAERNHVETIYVATEIDGKGPGSGDNMLCSSLRLEDLRLLNDRLPEFAKKLAKIKERDHKEFMKSHKRGWNRFWK